MICDYMRCCWFQVSLVLVLFLLCETNTVKHELELHILLNLGTHIHSEPFKARHCQRDGCSQASHTLWSRSQLRVDLCLTSMSLLFVTLNSALLWKQVNVKLVDYSHCSFSLALTSKHEVQSASTDPKPVDLCVTCLRYVFFLESNNRSGHMQRLELRKRHQTQTRHCRSPCSLCNHMLISLTLLQIKLEQGIITAFCWKGFI